MHLLWEIYHSFEIAYSVRQGEWDGIVRAYEKELLQIGEAAQIMVHYTDYEMCV